MSHTMLKHLTICLMLNQIDSSHEKSNYSYTRQCRSNIYRLRRYIVCACTEELYLYLPNKSFRSCSICPLPQEKGAHTSLRSFVKGFIMHCYAKLYVGCVIIIGIGNLSFDLVPFPIVICVLVKALESDA